MDADNTNAQNKQSFSKQISGGQLSPIIQVSRDSDEQNISKNIFKAFVATENRSE